MLLVIWMLGTSSVFAEKEFSVSLDATYRYDKSGVPTVEQKVTLTNLTQYMYANTYEMILIGDTPKNIKAFDEGGAMKIDEKDTDNGRKIIVNFNLPVAGRDKTYQFRLSYEGKPAIHNGQVWEVNFPSLANPDGIDKYRLSVIIPKNFGKLAFSSPNPESNNGEVMIYTNNQGAQFGIVAAFGDFQTYEFDLTYYIDHSQSIALPSDTGYQRVFFDKIEPLPENISTDLDGNWLASYKVKDKEIRKINVLGHANVLSENTQLISGIDYHNLTNYTKSTKYWPSTDEKFQKLARIYKSPREIYDFVVTTLKYDSGKNPVRLGALEALDKPSSALCTEFSDLFITMSRAAGVPSREVNGFAYTSDQSLRPLSLGGIDVLHSWVQYWDFGKSTWISIDPTWGSTTRGIDYFTKLDFNHLTFVTHGLADESPKSAGFYKLAGNTDPSVSVKIVDFKDYPNLSLKLDVSWPFQIWSPVGAKAYLNITNPNPYALYNITLLIRGKNIALEMPISDKLDLIAPFATIPIEFGLKPGWKLNFNQKIIEFEVSNVKLTYNISDVSYLFWHATIAIISSFALIVLGIITSRVWSLHIQKRTI